MKQTLSYFAMALMITALTMTTGLAQGKSRSATVTLNENLMVAETPLQQGSYRMKFNAETSELQILRDGDVIKTVKARVVEESVKAPYTAVTTKQGDKGKHLVSLRFEGDRRTILLTDVASSSTTGEGQNQQ